MAIIMYVNNRKITIVITTLVDLKILQQIKKTNMIEHGFVSDKREIFSSFMLSSGLTKTYCPQHMVVGILYFYCLLSQPSNLLSLFLSDRQLTY